MPVVSLSLYVALGKTISSLSHTFNWGDVSPNGTKIGWDPASMAIWLSIDL